MGGNRNDPWRCLLRLSDDFSNSIKTLPLCNMRDYIFYCVVTKGKSIGHHHADQRRVFLGLVFSCLGDAFLVWDGRSLIYTYAGIVAFGVAHLAYISAFGFSKPYFWFKGVPFFSA